MPAGTTQPAGAKDPYFIDAMLEERIGECPHAG